MAKCIHDWYKKTPPVLVAKNGSQWTAREPYWQCRKCNRATFINPKNILGHHNLKK